jgi:hypothetical protein
MSSPEELLRHADNTSSKNDTTSTRRPPATFTLTGLLLLRPPAAGHLLPSDAYSAV